LWVGSEPSDVREFLVAYTRSDGGYPATSYRLVRCPCSTERFRLERAGDVTRRTCVACGRSHFICRQADDWQEAEAEEGAESYGCVECGCREANLVVGFVGYEDNPEIDGVKWLYVGVRCAACGILGCFNDCKVGWGPASEVYEAV
jgi:hypothetical protein